MRYTPQSLRKHATSDDPLSKSAEEQETTGAHERNSIRQARFFVSFLFVTFPPVDFLSLFPTPFVSFIIAFGIAKFR